MTPSVRTLQGSKIKSFKGSSSLCPRGSNSRGFSIYHREIQLDANLPFETFWTVDDYYNHLQSTNSLKTEAGYLAEVIKSEKINGRIIVLSRDPNTIKTIYPYHISIITVSNGDILQNKVADFINRKSAMDAYYERLNAMRRHSITTEDNCGLPF